MTFSTQQRKNAYSKFSPEIQEFIMSAETSDLITTALKEAGLTESQQIIQDREVLDAVLGLQTLDSAIQKIASATGMSPEKTSILKLKLDESIFSEFKKTNIDLEEYISDNENYVPLPEPLEQKQIKDIIVPRPATTPQPNPVIPKETHIATIPGEKAHEVVPKPSQPAFQSSKPSVDQIKTETEVKKTYPPGQDPYREPI